MKKPLSFSIKLIFFCLILVISLLTSTEDVRALTATGYFNAYDIAGEEWDNSPELMVDGLTTTYAYTEVKDTVQLLTAHTCSAISLAKISKVELQAYGYVETNDSIYIRPVFAGGDGDDHSWSPGTTAGWSTYIDITSDTNAPSQWSWTDVINLDVDIEQWSTPPKDFVYIARVEIQVTYDTYTAPTLWESYSDAGHTTIENNFIGETNHVYMYGEGFPSGTTKVGYYDGDNAWKQTDTELGWVGGTLNWSECLLTTWAGDPPTAAAGDWHAVVLLQADDLPATYAGAIADPDFITDDIFNVAASAIPEFPAVMAAIGVAGLCFGIYYWMRRKRHSEIVNSQQSIVSSQIVNSQQSMV